MDRLGAMAVLAAVIETGSLSAAGRRLGMPLPTVSRKISDLEAHLKTRILIRSTRRLRLTDSGTNYLAACRRILEQVEDAERVVAGEFAAPRGELNLAAPVVFGRLHILPIVSAFLGRFPEVRVNLNLSDRNSHLIDDHIDVAVRIGTLPDSALVATRVGAMRSVVCASPAFLAKHGEPRIPEDLSDVDCVTFDALGLGGSWTFADPGASDERRVAARSRLSVNTAEAAIDAACAGVGLTRVLSYQAEAAVKAGALKIVLKDFQPEPVPVTLLHAGQGLLPQKSRAFLDLASPILRQVLS